MQLSHHSDYVVPLPDGHPFPMGKYALLREILLDRGVVAASHLIASEPIAIELLRSVHTDAYLAKLQNGGLTAVEQRRIGVPWSPALWRRSRLAAQGTLNAARNALRVGLSGNLAGGTHHAFADRGEGFCVLNDVAISIRVLQRERLLQRALIIDLDVHQGNGTAAIFEHDPSVYTFSVHGERNYPSDKMRSSLDIGLADGTDDQQYLRCIEQHLPAILRQFRADIVFYLAGVDVAAGDRYGRFALSDDGIRARERYVIEQVRIAGLPLVITLAGGYAATPQRTAELHALVFEEARRVERSTG
ncbi:MAG TPA: histone deacetylase [Steroidobacteraceae bacterium]|nr:histone deacetylase [Steroidobacteraceae bacterium]HRX87809.1 histone deacetylase [Steroidobacteraceae bacterium]